MIASAKRLEGRIIGLRDVVREGKSSLLRLTTQRTILTIDEGIKEVSQCRDMANSHQQP